MFATLILRSGSSFVFLAAVYVSLNGIENLHNRLIVAGVVLLYTGLGIASVLQAFYFLHRVERLELECRRLVHQTRPDRLSQVIVTEVAHCRLPREAALWIELLFLAFLA